MKKSLKSIIVTAGMLMGMLALLLVCPSTSIKAGAVGPEVAVGIDVSKYQGGINWGQVAS